MSYLNAIFFSPVKREVRLRDEDLISDAKAIQFKSWERKWETFFPDE